MKKIFILTIFIVGINISNAQQPASNNPFSTEASLPKHDFRIGIGAVMFEKIDMSNFDIEPMFDNRIVDFNPKTYYRGMVFTTGIITANYTYQAKKWLGIGLSASYAPFFNDLYDAQSNAKIGSGIRNRLAVYPLIRVNWMRIRNLQFYSEAGLGLGITMENENVNGSSTNYLTAFTSGQLTFLGLSFGEKIYLYSNLLGIGNAGYVGLGLGYRFDVEK
jgi:hypothetical protein